MCGDGGVGGKRGCVPFLRPDRNTCTRRSHGPHGPRCQVLLPPGSLLFAAAAPGPVPSATLLAPRWCLPAPQERRGAWGGAARAVLRSVGRRPRLARRGGCRAGALASRWQRLPPNRNPVTFGVAWQKQPPVTPPPLRHGVSPPAHQARRTCSGVAGTAWRRAELTMACCDRHGARLSSSCAQEGGPRVKLKGAMATHTRYVRTLRTRQSPPQHACDRTGPHAATRLQATHAPTASQAPTASHEWPHPLPHRLPFSPSPRPY